MNDRREFVKTILAGASAALFAPALPAFAAADPWAQVPAILKRIKAPAFPKRDFDVTRYGARPDGRADSTEAFRKAIDACNRAGGGRVVVPAGEFLTGPIHLKSNVNLHVSEGATVKFSQDPKAYLPLVFSRWEGME
ncbi:MAG TPA: glycosyl hydrolase family 28-related protein, partial [Pyrinomonadaceae bacterium]|nr:glycosyl hydrolase family 28-related protein [Pyrinomonadaceae bacterium]